MLYILTVVKQYTNVSSEKKLPSSADIEQRRKNLGYWCLRSILKKKKQIHVFIWKGQDK